MGRKHGNSSQNDCALWCRNVSYNFVLSTSVKNPFDRLIPQTRVLAKIQF